MRWTDTLSKTGEQVIFYACGQAICITGDEQVFYSKWISNRWYIATEGEQVISYNRWLSTCLSIFTQAVQQVKQNCVQVLSSSLMLTILVLSRLNTLSTARIAELWKLSISSSHPTGQPSVLKDKYLLTCPCWLSSWDLLTGCTVARVCEGSTAAGMYVFLYLLCMHKYTCSGVSNCLTDFA